MQIIFPTTGTWEFGDDKSFTQILMLKTGCKLIYIEATMQMSKVVWVETGDLDNK